MSRVRVLLAPDKFKGTLRADEAAAAMAAGVRDVVAEAELVLRPIADGGEGTCEVALAAGARRHAVRVRGPLAQPVEAGWARFDDGRAVLETAQASGLALLEPTPATALAAHSWGSGELVRAALDSGADRLLLGIGGSAMTDGGSGALRSLGARVLDADGEEVPLGGAGLAEAVSLDLTGLDPRLAEVELAIGCDVDSPLTGPAGAAAVFGPQKGADAEGVAKLDAALGTWAGLLRTATGVDVDRPGCGAAGGFPAAFLATTGVRLRPGFDLVAELLELEQAVAGADLVVTGEGSLDAQSLRGKGPIGVVDLARRHGVDVVVVAGVVGVSPAELAARGVRAAVSCLELAPHRQGAMAEAARWTRAATAEAVRRYGIRQSGAW